MSSSRTWMFEVNRPFSRSRGISCSRSMAASMPFLASSNTPSFASSWPTVRASRSAYVNCTLRSLRPAIAFVTTSVISGPSVFTGAAGARASSAARASAASRYPRMSNPVSFSVFIHSTIFSAGSMASFDLRVSSAATSRDFREASGPAASRSS